MSATKHLNLPKETHNKLMVYKVKHGFRSAAKAIDHLLKDDV